MLAESGSFMMMFVVKMLLETEICQPVFAVFHTVLNRLFVNELFGNFCAIVFLMFFLAWKRLVICWILPQMLHGLMSLFAVNNGLFCFFSSMITKRNSNSILFRFMRKSMKQKFYKVSNLASLILFQKNTC